MIKRTLIFLFWALMILWSVSAGQERITTSKHDVIKITLDWQHKIVINAVSNWQNPKHVKDFMNEVWWVSAINWAFFCPQWYDRCTPNTSDFIRINDGNLYATYWQDVWASRTLIGFDYDWVPMALRRWSEHRANWVRYTPWMSDVRYWLNMYTLVKAWRIENLSPMNRDDKQRMANTKQFLCYTEDKQTVYMWSVFSIWFSDLWEYVKNTFWCYEAIQLDSWWSRAMVYNNSYVAWPWRKVMDAIVVVPTNNYIERPLPNAEENNIAEDEYAIRNHWDWAWKAYVIFSIINGNLQHKWSFQYQLQERKKYYNACETIGKMSNDIEVKSIVYNLMYWIDGKIQKLSAYSPSALTDDEFNCLIDPLS